jgi:hypothetical protein
METVICPIEETQNVLALFGEEVSLFDTIFLAGFVPRTKGICPLRCLKMHLKGIS